MLYDDLRLLVALTDSFGLQPEVMEFFLYFGTQTCIELFPAGGPAHPYSALLLFGVKLILFVLFTLTKMLHVWEAIWKRPSSKFLLLLYCLLKWRYSHIEGIFFYGNRASWRCRVGRCDTCDCPKALYRYGSDFVSAAS